MYVLSINSSHFQQYRHSYYSKHLDFVGTKQEIVVWFYFFESVNLKEWLILELIIDVGKSFIFGGRSNFIWI